MASRLQDVLLRGTRANQPAIATVAPGTLYYVTDESVTERAADDNSAWESYSDGGGFSALRVSAGTLSQNITNLVFSNSNGISFGLSASTITASVTSGLSNVNISAGTTSNNLSNFVFSNSNNISFGLNGSTITATATVVSTQGNINISAGTTSNLSSNFIFSNSNNVSFGIAGNTVTATASFSNTGGGAAGTINYFENIPILVSSGNLTGSSSAMFLAPLILQANIDASFVRLIGTNQYSQYTIANTTANTTWTGSQSWHYGVQLFTKGTGASSLSMMSHTSWSTCVSISSIFAAGAVGSNYTASFLMTYPRAGGSSTFSTSYAVTSGSYVFSTSIFTNFNDLRWLDLPFSSLSPGNYWLGIGISSTSSNNGGPAGLTKGHHLTFIGAQQVNVNISDMGTNTSGGHQFGAGFISTNSQFITTSNFGVTLISTIDFQKLLFFQVNRI